MDGLKNARNLVKGSGFALAANLINGAIGFVTSILIAKTLGTESYGNFSLTLAVFGIVMAASSLGIGQATARYISDFVGQKRYAAAAGVLLTSSRMVIAIFSASAVLLYLFSGAIAGFFAKDIGPLLRIMAPGVFLGGIMAFLLSSLQGFQLFGYYSSTEIVHNSSKLIAIALLLWAGLGSAGAAAGIVVGYVAAAAIGVFLLGRGANLEKKENAIGQSALVRMGIPLAAAGYLLFMTTRGSTYLLGIFASSTEVGAYSAALIFGYEFFVLSDSLNAAFFPVFSAVHGGGGKGRFAAFFSYTMKFGSIIVFPVIAYVGIFAPQMIGLLLGANYSQSAGALKILLLLGLSYFFYATCVSAFVAMGMAKKVLVLSAIPLTVVFLAGRVLIPRYGISGAAATDSIAFALAAAAAAWALWKETRMSFPLRAVSKVAASATGMGVFLLYASGFVKTIYSGLLLSAASLAVYGTILLAARIFEKSDILLIEKIFIGSVLYPLVRRLCGILRRLV